MVSRLFTFGYATITSKFWKILTLLKKPHTCEQSLLILLLALPPPPQHQKTTSLLSVGMDLPLRDISYKWNHTICVWLLWLTANTSLFHCRLSLVMIFCLIVRERTLHTKAETLLIPPLLYATPVPSAMAWWEVSSYG